MQQQVVHSSASTAEAAIDEVCSKLGHNTTYQAILFFASTKYDFNHLSQLFSERYPHCQIAGTTTSGEISPDGFTKGGLVVSALSWQGAVCSGVIFDNADQFPYIHKANIEKAAAVCGISPQTTVQNKNVFAITFICAMHNAEESVLALLHSILGNDLPVAGGSAGDDGAFKNTSVSYNGTVVSAGAVVLFFKTSDPFDVYRENIFRSTGKAINITDADPEKRIILSIDGQNPQRRYAEMLGISTAELTRTLDDHPFGRVFGNEIFISSLASFNHDGTINMFSRVLPNTPVEILEFIHPVETAQSTCDRILQKIPHPGAVFLINCLQRTTRFERLNLCGRIKELYDSAFHTYFGFTSYGEQINRINSNQTLVTLVVGA
jgi:hypothetical protein